MVDFVGDVLDFWFCDRVRKLWFVKSDEFDLEISEKFLGYYQDALEGKFDKFLNTAHGCLALVILFDQFPRNMFRNTYQAFMSDKNAMQIAQQALDNKFDTLLTAEQRSFLYMPFMHSEELNKQELSVKLYKKSGNEQNLKFAIAHYNIIKKFNRFPHRNQILNRKPSQAEIDFLKTPNSSF